MVKLIIFDFCGTLARPREADWDEFFLRLADFSIRITANEQAQKLINNLPDLLENSESWEQFTNRFIVKSGVTVEREERERLQSYLEKKLGFKLYDDVVDILNLPQKKAILTLSPRLLVASLPQMETFEIFTPKEAQAAKPDKNAFLKVLEKFQIDSSEALMVGDSVENDIMPARKLGIKAVLLDRSGLAQGAGDKISSLKEIKKFL